MFLNQAALKFNQEIIASLQNKKSHQNFRKRGKNLSFHGNYMQ
jgi:hypothetical protein